MERQPGNVPYEAEKQAMSLNDQCSFSPDKRAVKPNPTQAMSSAKSVILPFMVTILHTDLVYQNDNPSRQHLKILCREGNVWIDVMGVLSTGIEDNWIGGHALNRSGPQPRSRIPEETCIDTQGGRFSATETVTICWRAANGSYIDEGEFRVMENGPFDIILGSKLLYSRGIYTFNEQAPLLYHKKVSKGAAYHIITIYHYTDIECVRGWDADAASEVHSTERKYQPNPRKPGVVRSFWARLIKYWRFNRVW